jgi:Holliday junction resolvase RusA-like endonuclease
VTQFVIPGKPYAKKRHRVGIIGKRARAFNPAENGRFEDVVRNAAASLFPAPLVGPVRLSMIASFALPVSWSKRKRAAMLGRPHTQKPDADNLAKAVKDGLNRIAWSDDCQVCDLYVRKVWAETAGTLVEVLPE